VPGCSFSVSYDSKGNCIPTILLMMQDRLYSQGDLKVSITKPLNVQTVGIFMLTLQYWMNCLTFDFGWFSRQKGLCSNFNIEWIVFRLNPENSQEKHARDQLNRGIVPDDTSVHCLAGLIKAWFRELPSGVLDGLSPEQVLQCNTRKNLLSLWSS